MAAYPLIGVSGSIDAEETRHFILRDYLRAVIAAGGAPVLLSPDMEGGLMEDCVARLDGLLLAGGNDVSPVLFGEQPIEALGEVNPLRDAFEMRLVRLAAQRGLPTLGICRGVQAMAAARGGAAAIPRRPARAFAREWRTGRHSCGPARWYARRRESAPCIP